MTSKNKRHFFFSLFQFVAFIKDDKFSSRSNLQTFVCQDHSARFEPLSGFSPHLGAQFLLRSLKSALCIVQQDAKKADLRKKLKGQDCDIFCLIHSFPRKFVFVELPLDIEPRLERKINRSWVSFNIWAEWYMCCLPSCERILNRPH